MVVVIDPSLMRIGWVECHGFIDIGIAVPDAIT